MLKNSMRRATSSQMGSTFLLQRGRAFLQELPRRIGSFFRFVARLDGRIVLYTLVCSVFATLLCGLFPAFRGTRGNLSGALAQASRFGSGSLSQTIGNSTSMRSWRR